MPTSINRPTYTQLGRGYSTSDPSGNPIVFLTKNDSRIFRYGKEGHWGYPKFPPNHGVGGPMYLEGVTQDKTIIPVGEIWGGGPLEQRYVGSLCVDIANTGAWNGTFLPDSWGPTAYSRMKPTKPTFSGLNALYELKDLPGMLRQRFHVTGLKDVSNHWVGIQFGWLPLLRDVKNLVSAQQTAQKRLAQLMRDNGKSVRRRVTLLDTSVEVENFHFQAYGAIQPVFESWYYNHQPYGQKRTVNSERVWASARMKYWLPPGPKDVEWTAKMMRRLYGLSPSPSAVYNMIPWSWLIDWFSNTGDLIENLDAGVADRLAADYFYVMREKRWTISQTAVATFHRRDNSPVSVSGTSVTEAFVKTRGVGDPFGWGTPDVSLSGMQLSILGALGLSRLR